MGIKNIENWFPWDETDIPGKEKALKRYRYLGNDGHDLRTGAEYDLTVSKSGGVYISVHLDKMTRVYKRYDTAKEFADEWEEVAE